MNQMPSPNNMMDLPQGQEPPINLDNNLPSNDNLSDINQSNNVDDFEDGNEETDDPKTEIQKLTGQLSQKLNNYVQQNSDDSETSKYVLSMIAKQASKNMSDEDKKDVIKKMKSNNDELDDAMDSPIDDDGITESFTSVISNDSANNDAKNIRDNKKPLTRINSKSPFSSNR